MRAFALGMLLGMLTGVVAAGAQLLDDDDPGTDLLLLYPLQSRVLPPAAYSLPPPPSLGGLTVPPFLPPAPCGR